MRLKIKPEMLVDIYDFYRDTKLQQPTMTWDKFARLTNEKFGYDFGESAYRKQIANYQKELIGEELLTPKERLIRADIRNQQNVLTRQQLNQEYRELRKEYLRNETLKEAIARMVAPKSEFKPLTFNHTSDISNLFIVSDIQDWDGKASKLVLEYVWNVINKTIEDEELEEIYLIELGDMIEGQLAISFLVNNKASLMEQIISYQTAMAELLERLTTKVKVNFGLVNSNHGQVRQLGIKASELPNEDVSRVILSYLQAYHKNNPNINWLNGDDLECLEINIQGFNCLALHGHQKIINIKNPETTFFKASQYYSHKNWDYLLFGHYHHFRMSHVITNQEHNNDKMVILVPALDVRMNKSNERSMGLSSKPSFIRLGFQRDNGIVSVNKYDLPKEFWK